MWFWLISMGSPSSPPFFFVYALQCILSIGFIFKKEKESSYQLGFRFTLTTWYEKWGTKVFYRSFAAEVRKPRRVERKMKRKKEVKQAFTYLCCVQPRNWINHKYSQFTIGVLVKVENGDKQFWEQNFHAPNVKPQHALKVPCFSLLSFGAWDRKIFFQFSFVPNRVPMCSPRVFQIAPCFNALCFAQSPPLLTYMCGPKGRHSIFP